MRLQNVKPGDKLELALLGTCKVTEVGSGYYRTCVKAETGQGKKKVVKVFACEAVTVPRLESGELMNLIELFAKELHDLGIATPDPMFWTEPHPNGSGRDMVDLYEVAEDVGPCLETEIRRGKDHEIHQAVERILIHGVAPLFASVPPDQHHLPMGIDLIPRNFAWKEGKLYYFDFMPPFVIFDDDESRPLRDRQLQAIPHPTDPACLQLGQWRHYNKGGLCQVLLIQLARLRPEMYNQFLEWITKFLQKSSEWAALQQFQERKAAALAQHGTNCQLISRFVKEAAFADVYDLRELGCLAACDGKLSGKNLNQIFLTSHFLGEPLSEEQMTEVKGYFTPVIN